MRKRKLLRRRLLPRQPLLRRKQLLPRKQLAPIRLHTQSALAPAAELQELRPAHLPAAAHTFPSTGQDQGRLRSPEQHRSVAGPYLPIIA